MLSFGRCKLYLFPTWVLIYRSRGARPLPFKKKKPHNMIENLFKETISLCESIYNKNCCLIKIYYLGMSHVILSCLKFESYLYRQLLLMSCLTFVLNVRDKNVIFVT